MEKGRRQKNIILDAVKKIVTIIAVPLLLLLIFSSYTYIKNYRKKTEANRLYREGLKPIMDRNNQFNPQAELNFYDSLLKQPMPQEQLFVIFPIGPCAAAWKKKRSCRDFGKYLQGKR